MQPGLKGRPDPPYSQIGAIDLQPQAKRGLDTENVTLDRTPPILTVTQTQERDGILLLEIHSFLHGGPYCRKQKAVHQALLRVGG